MTQLQRPRIDLNHGFMRFIRRNQLDRDEFNRIHEERKSEIRKRIEEQRALEQTRRPDVYVPSHLPRQEQEQKQQKTAAMASRGLSHSDSSDSSSEDEEKDVATCPILQKQQAADDRVRWQVRKRIERTYLSVDEICSTLSKYTLQNAENRITDGKEHVFTLELTLENGEQKEAKVTRNTKAATLAKSLSREHNFDHSQTRKLRLFIEEQLEHRLARLHSRRSPPRSVQTSPISTSSESSSSMIPLCVV